MNERRYVQVDVIVAQREHAVLFDLACYIENFGRRAPVGFTSILSAPRVPSHHLVDLISDKYIIWAATTGMRPFWSGPSRAATRELIRMPIPRDRTRERGVRAQWCLFIDFRFVRWCAGPRRNKRPSRQRGGVWVGRCARYLSVWVVDRAAHQFTVNSEQFSVGPCFFGFDLAWRALFAMSTKLCYSYN